MQVLKFYNLEGQSKWLNLLYETCFLFLFLTLAWWAIHSPLRSTSRFSTCSFATIMQLSAGQCGFESALIFLLVQGWASIQAPHQPLMTATLVHSTQQAADALK